MSEAIVLRILMSASGIGLIFISFVGFIKKKLTDKIALIWILFSVCMFLLGCLPGVSLWAEGIAGNGAVALFCFLIFAICGMFWLSKVVSRLEMQSKELAMQVALLNQENELVLSEMKSIRGEIQNRQGEKAADEKKDTICD